MRVALDQPGGLELAQHLAGHHRVGPRLLGELREAEQIESGMSALIIAPGACANGPSGVTTQLSS